MILEGYRGQWPPGIHCSWYRGTEGKTRRQNSSPGRCLLLSRRGEEGVVRSEGGYGEEWCVGVVTVGVVGVMRVKLGVVRSESGCGEEWKWVW